MTDHRFVERSDPEPSKMMGYLEKKIKMLGWRRYWFVLDGRLLTYYKSQLEYKSLSACSGSINLGIAINVSPLYTGTTSKGFPLQIVTRTQVYFLRASEKSELNHWLIAIQEGVEIPPRISSVPVTVTPSLNPFRNRNCSSSSSSITQIGSGSGSGSVSASAAGAGEDLLDAESSEGRVQYLPPFRSSLSALSLSQWSVNTSNEDLTNYTISGCPSAGFKNPKEKSLLKKYYSLASLNFPFKSDKSYINNNYYNNSNSTKNNKTNSLKNKNKTRVIDSYDDNISSLNHAWKSSSNVNEMQEIIPRNKTNFTKVRNTSSMLALGGSRSGSSSPQHTTAGSVSLSSNSFRGGDPGSRKSTYSIPNFPVTGPVERIVTWDNTSQCQSRGAPLTTTANMKRNSGLSSDAISNNIYTNTNTGNGTTGDEISGQGQGQGQGQPKPSNSARRRTPSPDDTTTTSTPVNHDYDEILDLKIKGSPKQDPKNHSEGIYENLESGKLNEDPWEKLPSTPPPTPTSITASRNRKSLQSMGRNSLVSIEEIAETNSANVPPKNSDAGSGARGSGGSVKADHSHSPKSTLLAPLTSTSELRQASSVPQSQSQIQKNELPTPEPVPLPTSTDPSNKSSDGKSSKKRNKKTGVSSKKSFSGFFHKIFHKSDKKKNQSQSDEENKEMIITGPVDLRKHKRDQKLNAALSSRKTPEVGVPFTQQSPQTQNQNASPGSSFSINGLKSAKPAIGSGSNDLLAELNKRFGSTKRISGSEESSNDGIGISHSQQLHNSPSHERILQARKSQELQQNSLENLDKSKHDNKPPHHVLRKKSSSNDIPAYSVKTSAHLSMTHTPLRPPINIPIRAVSISTGESEEFLRKLAHFNRLSASLDPSFVAAVSTLRSASFASNFGLPMHRSNSLRIRSSVMEEPPVLPPKRRQVPPKSLYDTPKNNSPVITTSNQHLQTDLFGNLIQISSSADPMMMSANANNYSASLRELTKKYSAPDISFNNPPELRMFRADPAETQDRPVLLRKSCDIRLQHPSHNHDNITNHSHPDNHPSLQGDVFKSNSFIPPPRPPKSERNSSIPPEDCMILVPSVKKSTGITVPDVAVIINTGSDNTNGSSLSQVKPLTETVTNKTDENKNKDIPPITLSEANEPTTAAVNKTAGESMSDELNITHIEIESDSPVLIPAVVTDEKETLNLASSASQSAVQIIMVDNNDKRDEVTELETKINETDVEKKVEANDAENSVTVTDGSDVTDVENKADVTAVENKADVTDVIIVDTEFQPSEVHTLENKPNVTDEEVLDDQKIKADVTTVNSEIGVPDAGTADNKTDEAFVETIVNVPGEENNPDGIKSDSIQTDTPLEPVLAEPIDEHHSPVVVSPSSPKEQIVHTTMPIIIDAVPFDEKVADENEIVEETTDSIQTTSDLENEQLPVACMEEITEVIEQSHTNEIKIIQPPVPVRHHAEVLTIDLPKMQSMTSPLNQSQSKINETDSENIPMQLPLTPSPSFSHKSVDIDSLEVLSDISTVSGNTCSPITLNQNPTSEFFPALSPPDSPLPIVVSAKTDGVAVQENICIAPAKSKSVVNMGGPQLPSLDAKTQGTEQKDKIAETVIIEENPKSTEDLPVKDKDVKEILPLETSPVNEQTETQQLDSDVEKQQLDIKTENGSEKTQAHISVEISPTELQTATICVSTDNTIELKSVEDPTSWKVNYATVNAVAWETVEETEEELNELYDEFPADINFTFPATAIATPVAVPVAELEIGLENKNDVHEDKYNASFRHSGIEQLQAFLFNEENQNTDGNTTLGLDWEEGQMLTGGVIQTDNADANASSRSGNGSGIGRGPALNRLGHSSAIEQLKRIFED